MKCDKNYLRLYAVTDRSWTTGTTLLAQVEAALRGGVTCVQLREKTLDDTAFLAEAIEMRALCRTYNVPFFVNDNVDIALKAQADGIHVGQSDMAAAQVREIVGKKMMLGVSASTVSQAVAAQKNGADCLGVGAIFSTATKTDAAVVPLCTVREICAAVDIPVVAIGGLNKSNIHTLKGSGVSGVALVSAIFSAADIEAECRALRAMSDTIFADTRTA